MTKLTSVFMGTPDYVMPSIETLYKYTKLKAVFTGRDKPTGRGKKITVPQPKQFANTHNIPVFQPTNFKNNTKIQKTIEEFAPDIIVVNAYGFILPKTILKLPKKAAINLHASLLPKYRGASPIQSAILEGNKETGVSAQLMSDKLDQGDIIYTIKTNIEDNEDFISLNHKLSIISAKCLKKVIQLYEQNTVQYIPQNHNEATFCKKIKKEDGLIHWNNPYKLIEQQIKAYIQWPQSYTYCKNKKLIINKINKHKEIILGEIGEITNVNKKEGIFVQCQDSIVNILSLKPEGKRFMDYASFLNGHSLKKGEKLSDK